MVINLVSQRINRSMSLFASAERLRIIEVDAKHIVLVNYSGLKQSEMIQLTEDHTRLVLDEARESYFIANYANAYGSPEYMKVAYAFTQATKPFIPKGAFLGIHGPKVALLRGVVYF